MTRVFIVRHAEAEGNLYRRVHGWYDSRLTTDGFRQLSCLADRFAGEKIDAVYASDLRRTRETAMALAGPRGLPVVSDARLREIGMGVWEDRPWGEVIYRQPDMLYAYNHDPERWKVEGSEAHRHVEERMREAFFEIARKNRNRTVVIASHGTAIRALTRTLLGIPLEEIHSIRHSDNTAVTYVEVERAVPNVVYLGDACHVPASLSTFAKQKWWRKGGDFSEKNCWFRPLDFDTEPELYYNARLDAWRTVHGTMDDFDGEAFLTDAKACSAFSKESVRVAMVDDAPVGIIQMDFQQEAAFGVGRIPFWYVMPGCRDQGYGVQMLGEAVSLCRNRGRDHLRLRVAPTNEGAIRFYTRYGFYRIGKAPGTRVPLDVMEKYIGFGEPHPVGPFGLVTV